MLLSSNRLHDEQRLPPLQAVDKSLHAYAGMCACDLSQASYIQQGIGHTSILRFYT